VIAAVGKVAAVDVLDVARSAQVGARATVAGETA
jgi:hypothetical protein